MGIEQVFDTKKEKKKKGAVNNLKTIKTFFLQAFGYQKLFPSTYFYAIFEISTTKKNDYFDLYHPRH